MYTKAFNEKLAERNKKEKPESSKKESSYLPPSSLYSVEALTRQFKVAEFGEDLPQTLAAVHQAVKDLRKEIKQIKEDCKMNHTSLSARMSTILIKSEGAKSESENEIEREMHQEEEEENPKKKGKRK